MSQTFRKVPEEKVQKLLEVFKQTGSIYQAAKEVDIAYETAKRYVKKNEDIQIDKNNYSVNKETLKEQLLEIALKLLKTFKSQDQIKKLPANIRGTLLGVVSDKIVKLDGDGNKQIFEVRNVAEDLEKEKKEIAEMKQILESRVGNKREGSTNN